MKHKQKLPQQFVDFKTAAIKDGWLVKTEPLLRFLDDEWVFVHRTDRLTHLFVSESSLEWEIKRFSRETFGDYTTPYKSIGRGLGWEAVAHIEFNKQVVSKHHCIGVGCVFCLEARSLKGEGK